MRPLHCCAPAGELVKFRRCIADVRRTINRDREAAAASPCAIYTYRSVHRHPGKRHCSRQQWRWPVVCRSRQRHLLPASGGSDADEETTAARSNSAAAAGASSAVGEDAHRNGPFRGVVRWRSEIRQDRLPVCGPAREPAWKRNASYASSHRCDLAHAGRRGSRPASRSTKNTAQLVMARSSEALEQFPI